MPNGNMAIVQDQLLKCLCYTTVYVHNHLPMIVSACMLHWNKAMSGNIAAHAQYLYRIAESSSYGAKCPIFT